MSKVKDLRVTLAVEQSAREQLAMVCAALRAEVLRRDATIRGYQAEIERLREKLQAHSLPTGHALTKLHDRAHTQKRHRVWRIVDWLVHSLDAETARASAAEAALAEVEKLCRAGEDSPLRYVFAADLREILRAAAVSGRVEPDPDVRADAAAPNESGEMLGAGRVEPEPAMKDDEIERRFLAARSAANERQLATYDDGGPVSEYPDVKP